MRLFIAEKPSLAKAIAGGLGKGSAKDGFIEINGGKDVVTWCFGHILRQLRPDEYDAKYKAWKMEDLPIIPAPWKLKVSESCTKQFKVIKNLIGQADEIVNGGDPDREGQLLVDEVLEYVGNKKPVKRILLNALDDVSVSKAIRDLRDNKDFIGLKNSALARSRADWLIGMNLSRAYTIKAREMGYDAISIGRVMTPTMALVVRRENEIKAFKPTTHYQLCVNWQHTNGSFKTLWQPKEGTESLDNEGHLLDKGIADALLNKLRTMENFQPKNARIQKLEKQKKTEAQRLCYSLSALQIEAGRKYGLSPQKVLDTMQELYEKKLTTYPRSDCDFLPESQYAEATEVVGNLKKISELAAIAAKTDLSIHTKVWNDKKVSAHHAIIPTRLQAKLESLSEVQQKLYLMVAKAYLAQFYPVHTYMSTKVVVAAQDELFSATGKQVLDLGWKAIYHGDIKEKDEEKDEEENATIPQMQEGDAAAFQTGTIAEKVTTPPKRFNPSTLLKAMKEIYKFVKDDSLKKDLKECSGIGTEATRAGIIDKLQTGGFFHLEKKYLVPDEKAYLVCKVLSDDILYPDTTAVWEQQLEEVKENRLTLANFFDRQKGLLDGFLASAMKVHIEAAKNVVKCPVCGKAMVRRKGSNGYFWGCTGYPDCKKTAPDKKGKPDFSAGGSSGLIATCPKCGKKLRQLSGKFGKFWSCEDRENCGAAFDDCKNKPIIVECTCGKGYLRKHKGKKGDFWSCNQYPSCTNTLEDNHGMPDMKKK